MLANSVLNSSNKVEKSKKHQEGKELHFRLQSHDKPRYCIAYAEYTPQAVCFGKKRIVFNKIQKLVFEKNARSSNRQTKP